jgi:hypothetical protein
MVSCEWVLFTEADERLPEVMLQNLHRVLADQGRNVDAFLLRRITYETCEGKVTRKVSEQHLPRLFRTGAGITWPPVLRIEAQGWSKASKYLLCCGRRVKYAVKHYNKAETFLEKRARYLRLAQEEWPKLRGTEWEEHMRELFASWGVGEEVYDRGVGT